MPKRIVSIFLLGLCNLLGLYVFAQNPYRYTIDLRNPKDDRLTVELLVNDLDSSQRDSISFLMPKIVPGTYHVYDFGRFVSNFKAFDKEGKELTITQKNSNEWRVPTKNLAKITYQVDDTFDSQAEPIVFEPGGTSIEDHVFIINTHGFFGYFEGLTHKPFEVSVLKPKSFYGSTSLVASKESTAEKDNYLVEDYHRLVDSPMMYCQPDTVTLRVGGADVLVSVYHRNKKVKAANLAKEIKKILEAQKNYLGGTLPIEKYAFLIYVFEGNSNSGSYGALEHSYSSLYYLPNYGGEHYLAQTVVDISAHEFFHILTPLTIHSEQIHYFDFNKPEMSRHLWLYEGVTEYFANHVQLQQGLISLEQFLEIMLDKYHTAQNEYSNVSFTELSLGCLDNYADQYGNVYEKGALIGWLLDIRLRELSDGKYGLMNLMQDLSKKYGKDKPFEDAKLFDVITELTYPEIRTFFEKYVEGNDPLPFENYLPKVGLALTKDAQEEIFNFGNISLSVDPLTKQISVFDVEEAEGFGKNFRVEDVLYKINKQKVTAENLLTLLTDIANNPNRQVSVVVKRKKGNRYKKTKIKAKPTFTIQKRSLSFEILQDTSPTQQKLLNAWAKWK